jgi:ketosteroid isomerase-like protein
MKTWILFAVAVGLRGPTRVCSQEASRAKDDAEEKAHEELRALRRGAEEAFNKGDIDGLLANYADKDVIVTWQNAEVNRGHQAVKDFYNRMMTGPDRTVESMESRIDVDDQSHLYGSDTATALGSMVQHFKLKDGLDFDLHSRWTATLIRANGRWKIAAFHVSTNMFDNGVLRLAVRKTLYWTGGIAAMCGLLLGLVAGRWSKRCQPAQGA